MDSNLNTINVRKTLWFIISEHSACDSNVRSAAIQLWKIIYTNHVFNQWNEMIKGESKEKHKKSKKDKKKKKEKKKSRDKEKRDSSPENNQILF